jgi:hypothetical protein
MSDMSAGTRTATQEPPNMPVENPYRNAELAMQSLRLTERDRGSHLRESPEEIRAKVEVARCVFSEPPNVRAPWGAITVPDLQEWYGMHGESRTEKEATRDIRTTEDMVIAPSDEYDVTVDAGFSERPVRVYHPRFLAFCAGNLWRYYDMSDLSRNRIAERYRIDPERVAEIFRDPESFVESSAFDYDSIAERYAMTNPMTGDEHVSHRSLYHSSLLEHSQPLWKRLTTMLGPSDFL